MATGHQGLARSPPPGGAFGCVRPGARRGWVEATAAIDHLSFFQTSGSGRSGIVRGISESIAFAKFQIQLSNSQEPRVVYASLRANGSRECAPDDRLREAIHDQSNGENGLLRRLAPRNDGQIQT